MRLPPFPRQYRASGLLLHVTSLPSRYGIGDIGPAAVGWVDRLHEAGQSWWQALPLGPTAYGDSPYQSLSSFAGNPLLISPDWLIEDDLVKPTDCAGGSFSATAVEFDAVKRFKDALLETAWKTFGAGARSDLHQGFERFGREQAHWLDDYALFTALKARYGGASYQEWPEELVRRTPAALDRARRDLAIQIDLARFGQFLLFRQGARLKTHARAKGVRVIGDLPFFVSPDSSDVWAHPELFLLDAQHRPRVVAGVPPVLQRVCQQRPRSAAQEARHSPADRDRRAREHLHRLDRSLCGGAGLRSPAGERCHRKLQVGRNEGHARDQRPQLCSEYSLDERPDRVDPQNRRLRRNE